MDHLYLKCARLGLASILSVMIVLPLDLQAAGKKGKSVGLDFEEDVVETSYLKPETTVVETLSKKRRTSLIRIRMDFLVEIIRSARNL